MRAAKGNKEYIIDESQQKSYQDSGFDILDDSGKTIAYGRGKTVPYDDYMKAVREIGRLQALAGEGGAEAGVLQGEPGMLQENSGMRPKKQGPAKAGG